MRSETRRGKLALLGVAVMASLGAGAGCRRVEAPRDVTPLEMPALVTTTSPQPSLASPASAPTSESQPDDGRRALAMDEWLEDASPCVYEEWRVNRSGYALDEILDRHLLASRWGVGEVKPGVTSERVLELLGEPDCNGADNPDCSPGYGPGMWLYTGSRMLMPNVYCHLTFDAQGVLVSVDWSGE